MERAEHVSLLRSEPKSRSDPKLFLWLRLARGLETGAYMAVFPICPDLVARAGVPEQDIGVYVGSIEAIFAVSQAMAMLVWPQVSSRFGEKTVLIACLTGTAVGTSMFGFATQIWQMLVIRSILGCFAASELTVRVMITEFSTKETAPRAFAWLGTAGSLFQIVTPALTGLLYNDKRSTGSHFQGEKAWLAVSPAALPCNVYAALTLASCLVLARHLPEAHKGRQSDRSRPRSTYFSLLRASHTRRMLFAFIWQFVLWLVIAALGPTFYYTSVALGGWGWSVQRIALYNTCFALSNAAWAAFGFHRTIARVGLSGGALIGAYATLIPPMWCIISSVLLRRDCANAFYVLLVVSSWAITWFHLTGGVTNQLALKTVASSVDIGSLNAVAYSMSAIAKAVVPLCVGPMFAASINRQTAGGHLVWILDLLLAVGYVIFVTRHLDLYRKGDDDDDVSEE